MANTYDPSAIGTDAGEYARFILGDTASPWLFADEEIEAILTGACDLRTGLVTLAHTAHLKVSNKADTITLGDEKKSWKDRAQGYLDLAARLTTMALPAGIGGDCVSAVIPVTGTMSKPDLTEFMVD